MADFQPPPTWASPILIDERTKESTFNPVWLKWFLDLVGIINASGGGGGAVTHNSTSGLQGGQANQFYHATATEYGKLQALGTISNQNANNVTITGGAVSGVTLTVTNAALTTPAISGGSIAGATSVTMAGREQNAQGAAVTAANNLTLGTDGNYFQVVGATQINLLSNVSWQGGSVITLKFNSTPTVKHNQAASGAFMPIILNGAVDFVAANKNTLTLVYDATDTAWYEVARKV